MKLIQKFIEARTIFAFEFMLLIGFTFYDIYMEEIQDNCALFSSHSKHTKGI